MDSSWQAYKVAEVGNSRWVIWGVQACYSNVKYTQKGKTYGSRFEDNWRLSSQFKHLHLLKCDGFFFFFQEYFTEASGQYVTPLKTIKSFPSWPSRALLSYSRFPRIAQPLNIPLTPLFNMWVVQVGITEELVGTFSVWWYIHQCFVGQGCIYQLEGIINPCCSVFPRFIVIALQCVVLLKLALFFFSLINRALGIIWGKGRSIWLDKKQWSARLAKIMPSRLAYTFLSTYDNKLFQIHSILILSVLRGNWICSQELFFCKSWKTCLCFFFSCWACLFSLSPLVVIPCSYRMAH